MNHSIGPTGDRRVKGDDPHVSKKDESQHRAYW